MNNINNSIVRDNVAVNPAEREAILSGHDKYGEAFEKLAEGEDSNGDYASGISSSQKAELEYIASVAKKYPEVEYVAVSPLSFESGVLVDHYSPIVGYSSPLSTALMEELEETLPKKRVVNWNPESARSDYIVLWRK